MYTGLGQFSKNFLDELLRLEVPDLAFSFLTPPRARHLPQHIRRVTAGWSRRYLPSLNSGFDVWHSLHQLPSHLPAGGTRHILTIHDLNFLTEKTPFKARKYLRQLQQNVDRASVITTISDYTRQHLLQHIHVGDKPLRVVYNGVALPSVAARKPDYAATPFFFSISVFKRAKNFHVLLPMLHEFPDHQLILAGSNDTPYGHELREMIRAERLEDRVVLPGMIDDAEKLWLYRNCDAFLFPSLAEGFGLPVVEAMMCGKPTILSRYTCLPEIGGAEAYYFESFEPQQMGDTVARALQEHLYQPEKAVAVKAYAQRYSWKECGRQYVELYRSF